MPHESALRLRDILQLDSPSSVPHRCLDSVESGAYRRDLIEYEGREGDPIRAFLFAPHSSQAAGGVVAFHQHNGEFHLGKSEVAGLAGDPLQAFGPALAIRGVAVLAPDAVTFEDRRTSGTGTEAGDGDWLQHYNAMAYRLVNGDILMRKCLDDAQRAVSVLSGVLNSDGVGVVGHSYGGTTGLYLAAVDDRCRFACLSGAVCSFEARQRAGTGINMFELVPGLASQVDVPDVLRAVSPRDVLVVSAAGDPYSADADNVVARAGTRGLSHLRVEGEHALDRDRFDRIVEWVAGQALRRRM